MRSSRSPGSVHRRVSASSARLVFATATRTPNWTISGSFSYCGAPPDTEMTVAIEHADRTAPTVVAAKAPTQLAWVGIPSGGAIAYTTHSDTTDTKARLLRLNAIFTACWRWISSAAVVPAREAS